MKRLQILIDEELASELERAAASTGRSKSALIREFVRQHLSPLPSFERDPLFRLAGKVSFDPAPVDDVVYGERKRSKRRAVARSRP
ncbi:MAG: CopG family transcriptional regulator [Chloroflexota bacterium]